MNFQNIHQKDKNSSFRKKAIFKTLNTFFSAFKNRESASKLNKKFLSIKQDIYSHKGLSGVIEDLKSIYEKAIEFVESETVNSGFSKGLLILQQNLYTELEYILSFAKYGPRHHFLIVIPVADRPLMLKNCLESLIEQYRTFRYGGFPEKKAGISECGNISVFIIDDSKDKANINKIREISLKPLEAGIRTYYIGLDEQTRFLKQIPLDSLERLSRLIGEFRDSVPSHKGASITRNIAYLYIHAVLKKLYKKALIYFIDSDEEFRIKIMRGDRIEDIQFVNYFYSLDKIFETTDVEVLTGKVVGDPPVSSSVMINTFLDDTVLFFDNISSLDMSEICCFHETQQPEPFSAQYHDMAKLFGYQEYSSPKKYLCSLSGVHNIKDCFEAFSKNAVRFFYGQHPTRTQFYNHTGNFTKTENARTVYTGNYVFNTKGFRHFIPFAHLNLRMAGPTLGRILKARLKNRFVSANLPLLHKRTLSDKYTDDFRSGISANNDSIDLSEEFFRQFWGDVMLFSIDALTESGNPDSAVELQKIKNTVNKIQEKFLYIYREQHNNTAEKILKLKRYLSSPGYWWNNRPELKDSASNFRLFCSLVEKNFGVNSRSFRKLSQQVREGSYTNSIIESIYSFYEDGHYWNELLKTDLTVPPDYHEFQNFSGPDQS